MPFTFNGTNITAVNFNGTNVTTVIFNGTTVFQSVTTTATPSLSTLSCACDFDGTRVIVTVTNNSSSSATLYAADNSGFSGQQTASVGAGGQAQFAFYGYLNPSGTVTIYAKAQASGQTMSLTNSRTQTLNFCLSEPGCGGGGGFGGF
jgi:hypothetical protein